MMTPSEAPRASSLPNPEVCRAGVRSIGTRDLLQSLKNVLLSPRDVAGADGEIAEALAGLAVSGVVAERLVDL
jgi:hypothetical protein